MEKSQLPPEEWLIELGKISYSWTVFEHIFNMMIEKLAGVHDPLDPVHTIYLAHMSFPQKMNVFKSLCAILVKEHPHLADYKDVAKEMQDIATKRNFFMHNMMGPDATAETAKFAKLSARGKLKMEFQELPLSDVKAVTPQINHAVKSVYRLVLQADPWNEQQAGGSNV